MNTQDQWCNVSADAFERSEYETYMYDEAETAVALFGDPFTVNDCPSFFSGKCERGNGRR